MDKEQLPENKTLNIFKLLIGLLFVIVGIAEVISKTTYTYHWFEKVEGPEVQVFGGIIAIYGAYLCLSASKHLVKQKISNERK